jgi:hypothetical protein
MEAIEKQHASDAVQPVFASRSFENFPDVGRNPRSRPAQEAATAIHELGKVAPADFGR